jgi:hypothetical protein
MSDLKLVWTPPKGKNKSGTLTAMLNDNVFYVDIGNLAKAKFRQDFAAKITSLYPAIMESEINEKLIPLAAEGVHRESDEKETNDPQGGDFKIVRPERFILSKVNGLLCPVVVLEDCKPVGRWKLYLRWNDGCRKEHDFEPTLRIDDSQMIYFVPTPLDPLPDETSDWSMDARRRWLAGETCPEPLAVFQKIRDMLDRFLEFDRQEETTAVLATWIILTYVYSVWPAVPYLNVTGPLGSGKSQLLDCLSRLVYRPLSSSSMTGPALFRTLHNKGGILILDEAERLRQEEQQELLTMLLAGYKRGGKATRLEKTADGQFITKQFDVYGPKVLGGIASLPSTLLSRCISIPMFRIGPESEKPRRRLDENPEGWRNVRDDLHAIALEHGPTFLTLANDSTVCPHDIGGRDYQLWHPPLAIGKWLDGLGGKGIHEMISNFARWSIEQSRECLISEIDEIVLTVFAEEIKVNDRLSPGDILAECRKLDQNLFSKWTAKGISSLLRRYGFQTTKSHGRRIYREVSIDDLKKVQTNYGIDLNL